MGQCTAVGGSSGGRDGTGGPWVVGRRRRRGEMRTGSCTVIDLVLRELATMARMSGAPFHR